VFGRAGWSQIGELPFREADSLQSEIAASVTGDYVRNTQILINLARYACRPGLGQPQPALVRKTVDPPACPASFFLHHRAIGRLVMLHKEINLLAGYTGRVWDLLALLETLQDKGAVSRKPALARIEDEEQLTSLRGEYEESDHTKLEDVSIVTPDGLVLVEGKTAIAYRWRCCGNGVPHRPALTGLTFDLPYGKNLLIYGPNGASSAQLVCPQVQRYTGPPLIQLTQARAKAACSVCSVGCGHWNGATLRACRPRKSSIFPSSPTSRTVRSGIRSSTRTRPSTLRPRVRAICSSLLIPFLMAGPWEYNGNVTRCW
jgi:hypothetical protein